jgi:hypothetical protein
MFEMISRLAPANKSLLDVPLFVAATGNDKNSTSFSFPAAYDQVIEVGSVNDLAESVVRLAGTSAVSGQSPHK